MADNANVRSLEQLELFLDQTGHFRSQLLAEIENLQLEMRRVSVWIETEAFAYWAEQLGQSQRRAVECQDALVRCMSYVREDERGPCSEEKKRLQRAQQRRALCEEKLRTVKGAATAWERQRTKNQSKVERCRDLAESDLVVAIHQLRGQIETLNAYAGLRSEAVTRKTAREVTREQSSIEGNSNREQSRESCGQPDGNKPSAGNAAT